MSSRIFLKWFYPLLSLGVTFFILCWRRPDAFSNPQFWAEDGAVFFQQQYSEGNTVIFKSYNGYLHFLPRLIAASADMFNIPLAYIPSFYNYTVVAITLLIVLSVWLLLEKPVSAKLFLALTITAIPVGSEVFMNIANLQWVVTPFLFLVLLSDRRWSSLQLALILVMVFLVGLTGPFSLIFLPCFFLKAWFRRKEKQSWWILLVISITAIIQAYFLLTSTVDRKEKMLAYKAHHYILPVVNYFNQMVTGTGVRIETVSIFSWIFFIAVLVGFVFLFIYQWKKRSGTIYLLSGLFLFALSTYYAFWPQEWKITPFGPGQRYFYLPGIFISWYVIFSIPKEVVYKLSIILISCFFVFHAHRMRTVYTDFQWKKKIDEYQKGGSKVVPINPPGWFVFLK